MVTFELLLSTHPIFVAACAVMVFILVDDLLAIFEAWARRR